MKENLFEENAYKLIKFFYKNTYLSTTNSDILILKIHT